MIVDAHTHVFPPSFIAERDLLLAEEPVFGELYASPGAALATAPELLRAMDEAGVDAAAIAGFAWADAGRCRRHNDALLEVAACSSGRLIALCCVPPGDADAAAREMERCAAAGACGFGELRLTSLAGRMFSDEELHAIAGAATALALPLLLHASEPVGHGYAGKTGGPLEAIWRLVERHPGLTTVLAHAGGGLPFYAHMPEVRAAFTRTYVDTAATAWLYDRGVYRALVDAIGADRVLFGSDFPLRHPSRDLALLGDAGLTDAERAAALGENARRLFRLAEE